MQKSTKKARSRNRGKQVVGEGKVVSNGAARVNVPFSLSGGFPDRVRVRLNYYEQVSHNTAVGTTYVWTGNGAFDPNVTSTGSQPYNYDDWAVQYNRYRVHGSSIKSTTLSIGNTVASTQYYAFCTPRHTTTTIVAAFDDAIAAPYCKWHICYDLNSGFRPGANDIRHSMSTQRFLGLTEDEYHGGDQYQALTTANPSHLWYWHTTTGAVDGSSTANINNFVTITYDVEFFDRLELTLDEMVKRVATLKSARQDLRKMKTEKKISTEAKSEATDQKDTETQAVKILKMKAQAQGFVLVANPVKGEGRNPRSGDSRL